MKKQHILILAIVLFVVLAALIGIIYAGNSTNEETTSSFSDHSIEINEVGTFSFSNYSKKVDTLAICHIIEPVEDAETAAEQGKMLWDRTFGYVSGRYFDPNPGESVAVYYDQQESCWLVTGTPPKADGDVDVLCAMPYVIILKTGKAYVWMG